MVNLLPRNLAFKRQSNWTRKSLSWQSPIRFPRRLGMKHIKSLVFKEWCKLHVKVRQLIWNMRVENIGKIAHSAAIGVPKREIWRFLAYSSMVIYGATSEVAREFASQFGLCYSTGNRVVFTVLPY